MQFHAIEIHFAGIPGGLHVFGHDVLKIGFIHGPGHWMGLHPRGVSENLPTGGFCHGTQKLCALGQVGWVPDATRVHELHENATVTLMDCLRHFLPARELFLAEKARNAGIP